MKTAGIPIWITIAMSLIVLLSFLSGGMAMVGNGMEDYMGPSWAVATSVLLSRSSS